MAQRKKKPSKREVDKYLCAVGRFVTTFAIVEKAVYDTLRHFVGVSPTIAACLFSGTRVKAAMDYLTRISEATNWSEGKIALLNHIKLQLGEITELRNDLLHYGPTGGSLDTLIITNAHVAHLESRIRETKISSQILDDAVFDLWAMAILLLHELEGKIDWSGLPEDMREAMEKAAKLGVISGAFATLPWHYKPERQGHQKRKLPSPPPKPKPRPRSSQA
jgi:hypothetical protein